MSRRQRQAHRDGAHARTHGAVEVRRRRRVRGWCRVGVRARRDSHWHGRGPRVIDTWRGTGRPPTTTNEAHQHLPTRPRHHARGWHAIAARTLRGRATAHHPRTARHDGHGRRVLPPGGRMAGWRRPGCGHPSAARCHGRAEWCAGRRRWWHRRAAATHGSRRRAIDARAGSGWHGTDVTPPRWCVLGVERPARGQCEASYDTTERSR